MRPVPELKTIPPPRIMPFPMTTLNGITFSVLGGGGEVGANCFLLEADGHQILLDCGTHPKKDGKEALPDLKVRFLLLPVVTRLIFVFYARSGWRKSCRLRTKRETPYIR